MILIFSVFVSCLSRKGPALREVSFCIPTVSFGMFIQCVLPMPVLCSVQKGQCASYFIFLHLIPRRLEIKPYQFRLALFRTLYIAYLASGHTKHVIVDKIFQWRLIKMSAIPTLLCILTSLCFCNGEKNTRILLNDPMQLESEIQQLRVALNDLTTKSKNDTTQMDIMAAKINDLTTKWTSSKNDVSSLKATVTGLQTQISAMQNNNGKDFMPPLSKLSTEGYSKSIVRKNNDKFGKRIGLNK